MISRELKLKLTKKQESLLSEWLKHLTSIYNFGLRKIELNAEDRIYFSKKSFQNLLVGHSERLGIPSHTIQAMLAQVWMAWQKCFKKISKKPKLKSIRNKLNSIPFPDLIPLSRLTSKTIQLPIIGKLKYFKQDLPAGKIKNARIIKRASGWYVSLMIDTKHSFSVKETEEKVGIDTGFKHLAVLSNGKKYENPRNYLKAQARLAQAQKGKNKKLVSRLNERIKNRRKDYNHKVSREIVENFKDIYITNDALASQARKFGKSIGDAGISQLRSFITYKSGNHGRGCFKVDSSYTTMACSSCLARTGPSGLSGLAVREWECCACGAHHDRDVNAGKVVLIFGLGYNLASSGGGIQCKI